MTDVVSSLKQEMSASLLSYVREAACRKPDMQEGPCGDVCLCRVKADRAADEVYAVAIAFRAKHGKVRS